MLLWSGTVGGSAPRSGGCMAGARSALRDLTCRILSERSERSERSELCGTPLGRAPQRSRRNAPTAPSSARPAHRLTRALGLNAQTKDTLR